MSHDPLIPATTGKKPAALRLLWVIVLETFLVALAGFLVWGIAWDCGFPKAGLALAIIVWVTVSPAIEIATVMKYRRSGNDDLS